MTWADYKTATKGVKFGRSKRIKPVDLAFKACLAGLTGKTPLEKEALFVDLLKKIAVYLEDPERQKSKRRGGVMDLRLWASAQLGSIYSSEAFLDAQIAKIERELTAAKGDCVTVHEKPEA